MINVHHTETKINPDTFQPEIYFTASMPLILASHAEKLPAEQMYENLGRSLAQALANGDYNRKEKTND